MTCIRKIELELITLAAKQLCHHSSLLGRRVLEVEAGLDISLNADGQNSLIVHFAHRGLRGVHMVCPKPTCFYKELQVRACIGRILGKIVYLLGRGYDKLKQGITHSRRIKIFNLSPVSTHGLQVQRHLKYS